MVHAKSRVVIGPRAIMEHGVRWVRACHPPTFGGESSDLWFDQLNLLAPELSTFAGVRVEAGNRETGIGDSEIALQTTQRCTATRFNQRGAEVFRNLAQRQVCRYGNGSKRRTGKHHH